MGASLSNVKRKTKRESLLSLLRREVLEEGLHRLLHLALVRAGG
jgi:hypothetical protein